MNYNFFNECFKCFDVAQIQYISLRGNFVINTRNFYWRANVFYSEHVYLYIYFLLLKCVAVISQPFMHMFTFYIRAAQAMLRLLFSCRGCGLYPEASRFFIFCAVIGIIHYTGEIITVLFLALFTEPPLAQSVITLTFACTSLLATGLLRY